MASYALPKSHQDVSWPPTASCPVHSKSTLQMLEKSLVETDSEVAEIMVIQNTLLNIPASR